MSDTTTSETTSETTTSVCFCRRESQRTRWIEIEFPEGQPPADLIGDLNAIGFVEDGLAQAPPLDGVDTVQLSKAGSGLFNDWTADEELQFVAAAEQVCARYGYADVPVNDLTYFDLA